MKELLQHRQQLSVLILDTARIETCSRASFTRKCLAEKMSDLDKLIEQFIAKDTEREQITNNDTENNEMLPSGIKGE